MSKYNTCQNQCMRKYTSIYLLHSKTRIAKVFENDFFNKDHMANMNQSVH